MKRIFLTLLVFILVGYFPADAQDDTDTISRIVFTSDRDGVFQIYMMDADGSNLHRVENGLSWGWGAVWSPDGKKIAFMSGNEGPFTNSAIFIMDGDGSNVEQLTSDGGFFPAWSPDGKQIAFTDIVRPYPDQRDEVFVMDADGSNPQRLTTNEIHYQIQTPKWSPDGEHIAFMSNDVEGGNNDVFVMNADGQNVRNLTDSPDIDEMIVDWSPDGSSIYCYWGPVPGEGENYALNISNGDFQPFEIVSGIALGDSSWSPNEMYVVYTGCYPDSVNPDICIVDADGQNVRNMTNHPAMDLWPDWSTGDVPVLDLVAEPVVADPDDTSTGESISVKPGYWEGSTSVWSGDVSFQVASDGTINDFRIRVPVFGNEQRGCEVSAREDITVLPDGFYAISIRDGSTKMDINGQFNSDTEMTASVWGTCKGDMILMGIEFEASWVRP